MQKEVFFIKNYPLVLLDFQRNSWLLIGQMMLFWGCVRNKDAMNV